MRISDRRGIFRGNAVKKKAVSQEKSRLTAFLCPIRSQCCTNYNAPTGALDTDTGREILKLLQDMSIIHKQTVVMVTHNSLFAEIANKVIKVKNGKIKEVYTNPEPKDAKEVNW